MSVMRRPIWLGLALVAYCAWRSDDIVGAWQKDPRNFFGWVAFLIWLSPLASPRIRVDAAQGFTKENYAFLWSGLGMSFIGTLGELNTLCYAGLACVLVGMSKWSWLRIPWLVAACCWMPLFGYALLKVFPQSVVLPARLTIAAIAAGWTFYAARRLNTHKS